MGFGTVLSIICCVPLPDRTSRVQGWAGVRIQTPSTVYPDRSRSHVTPVSTPIYDGTIEV